MRATKNRIFALILFRSLILKFQTHVFKTAFAGILPTRDQ